MNRLLFIRRNVFAITQSEMARIAGVDQGRISRWERGTRRPSLRELERIRAAAIARGLAWDDSLFFEAAARGGASAQSGTAGAAAPV